MTFRKRFRLPDVCYFIFNMGNGLKYALGDQGSAEKACQGKDKCNEVGAMCTDQLGGDQTGAIQSILLYLRFYEQTVLYQGMAA
jgi:hypothetical protein